MKTFNHTVTLRRITAEEKAGQIVDIVLSTENRKFYKNEEEKHQFIWESFKLDEKEILNADKKLKEAVIKLFTGIFDVLATHPSQYGET